MASLVVLSLVLSIVGGLSTCIGVLFVIIKQAPHLAMLGLLQGIAAGAMWSISLFDLVHNTINSIGFLKGNLWFFAGVTFFASVAYFIPEPTLATVSKVKSEKENKDDRKKELMQKQRCQVLFSAIITAIGISLHNIPEGMTAIKGVPVGLNLGLVVAVHSIPEGIALALPVYFATQSKWKAFKLATLSGFAEPLIVITVAYLFPRNLSSEILEGLLGSVGGMMSFLILHAMLPLSFECTGQKHAVKALFFGMCFTSASLYALESVHGSR